MSIGTLKRPCKQCPNMFVPTGKFQQYCARCKFDRWREGFKRSSEKYPKTKYEDTMYYLEEIMISEPLKTQNKILSKKGLTRK